MNVKQLWLALLGILLLVNIAYSGEKLNKSTAEKSYTNAYDKATKNDNKFTKTNILTSLGAGASTHLVFTQSGWLNSSKVEGSLIYDPNKGYDVGVVKNFIEEKKDVFQLLIDVNRQCKEEFKSVESMELNLRYNEIDEKNQPYINSVYKPMEEIIDQWNEILKKESTGTLPQDNKLNKLIASFSQINLKPIKDIIKDQNTKLTNINEFLSKNKKSLKQINQALVNVQKTLNKEKNTYKMPPLIFDEKKQTLILKQYPVQDLTWDAFDVDRKIYFMMQANNKFFIEMKKNNEFLETMLSRWQKQQKKKEENERKEKIQEEIFQRKTMAAEKSNTKKNNR